MSARKYTERDVLDNEDLEDVAVEYLEAYTGSFEFLIDMRMRVGAGYALTTGMVRGILNCMRNDPRVRTLPDVLGYEGVVQDAENVIPIRRKEKQVEPAFKGEECPQMGAEHGGHWFPLQTRSGKQHCIGWHAINRTFCKTTRARFHADYVRGRNSNLIHRSAHAGEVTWYTADRHAYGPSEIGWIRVSVVCPLPMLKEPDLLDADGVRAATPRDVPGTGVKYPEVTLCPRCFPGTALEQV